MIDYESLEEFKDPHIYDMQCDAFDDDFALVDEWVRAVGGPVLDLACGTGRMAIRLAEQGYEVTGVDIAPEMVALARQKAAARGAAIEWAVADARSFRLERKFSCVIMLMNAFQFLQEREDQEAMLARVREHLLPGGYFLFETRNPSPRNLYGLRHPEPQTYTATDGMQLVVTDEQRYDPVTQIQHYTCHQQILRPDGQVETRTRRTALRYVFPQEMEALLHYNGFKAHARYGDWQKGPLTADSPAMIYVCQRRR